MSILFDPKHGNFTTTPNALYDLPVLCPRDRLVLFYIIRYSYRKVTFEVSQSQIARASGYVRETVREAFNSLALLGIIERHGSANGKREIITLHLERLANLPKQSATSKRGNLPKESSGSCLNNRHVPAYGLGSINKKEKRNDATHPRMNADASQDTDDYDDDVMAFFPDVPREKLSEAVVRPKGSQETACQPWEDERETIKERASLLKDARLSEISDDDRIMVSTAIALDCSDANNSSNVRAIGRLLADLIRSELGAEWSAWTNVTCGELLRLCCNVRQEHGYLDSQPIKDAVDDYYFEPRMPFYLGGCK